MQCRAAPTLRGADEALGRRYGKVDADDGAVVFGVNAAFELDAAAVPFDKLPGYEQADSGADGIAGGKKGVENLREDIGRDADAVVLDCQNDFVADSRSDLIGDCRSDFAGRGGGIFHGNGKDAAF